MLDRWFLAHPRSVGESYFRHLRTAAGFAFSLLGAGLACLVHALIPALFETTASDAVVRLHGTMTARRRKAAAPPSEPVNVPRQAIVRAD
jgi:hypothetical protein